MVARYGLSVYKNSSTLCDKKRTMFLAQADYFTSTSSILKFSSNNLLVLNFINFKDFCLSEMLKNITIVISYCDFHVKILPFLTIVYLISIVRLADKGKQRGRFYNGHTIYQKNFIALI